MGIGLKIFRGSISLSKFNLMLPCLITAFLLVLLSACSPDSQIDPGGIDFGNNQQTEDFEVLDDDFETKIDPKNLPSREPNPCPGLDSQLFQLFMMENPIPSAEQLGFRVVNGKVHVLLILKNEKSALPEGFDLEIGTRVGDRVQVFTPFNALCDLANTDEIIAIRQPITPILE